MDKAEIVFVKYAMVPKPSKFPVISKATMKKFREKYTRKTSLDKLKSEMAQNRLDGRMEYFDHSLGANRNKYNVDNTSEYWTLRGMSGRSTRPSARRK